MASKSTRHTVKIRFEDGRSAWVVIDEDSEVSVRGLRNVVEVTYVAWPRG